VSSRLMILLAGAAMAAIVVLAGTMPEKADAAVRFKTVIKDFNNRGVVTIPASGNTSVAGTYPSTIDASGFRQGRV
jgi:hypothetical protein